MKGSYRETDCRPVVLIMCVCTVRSDSLWPPWTVVCQAPVSMEFSRQELLQWVAISSYRGSYQTRYGTSISCVSCIAGRIFFFFFFLTTESPGKPYSKHSVSYSLKLKAIKRPLQLEAEQYETEELRFWSLTPWIPKWALILTKSHIRH